VKSLFSHVDANLTRMVDLRASNDTVPLYLTDIVHKTVFQLDEEGTQAGAATAGFFIPLSGLMTHRVQNFTLDKPFIFFIRDAHSALIFQGVVTNIPGDSVTQVTPQEIFPENSNDSSQLNSTAVTPEGSLSKSNGTDVTREEKPENPWWVPKGTPAYLGDKYSLSRSNVKKGEVKKGEVKTRHRFQEPEPIHPEGIRFQLLELSDKEDDKVISPRVKINLFQV